TVSVAQDKVCDAIRHRDEKRARAMLEADSTLINACSRDGWTPLHVAAAKLDERMVAWLLEHGADVTPRGPLRQGSGQAGDRTPLDLAATSREWLTPRSAERFSAIVD